jgi:hypothetical protein
VTPEESCQAAETSLAAAQRLLSDPRPERLEQGLEALCRAIEIMENLAAGTSRDWDPAVHLAIHRVHASSRHLHRQVEHGTNLVRGWMQRKFGAGYNRGGLPEFTGRESARSFEA